MSPTLSIIAEVACAILLFVGCVLFCAWRDGRRAVNRNPFLANPRKQYDERATKDTTMRLRPGSVLYYEPRLGGQRMQESSIVRIACDERT